MRKAVENESAALAVPISVITRQAVKQVLITVSGFGGIRTYTLATAAAEVVKWAKRAEYMLVHG